MLKVLKRYKILVLIFFVLLLLCGIIYFFLKNYNNNSNNESFEIIFHQGNNKFNANSKSISLQNTSFAIEIIFDKRYNISLNVSSKDSNFKKVYDSNIDPKDIFEKGYGLAESRKNQDKNLFLSDKAYHYLYYESDSDHRCSKVKIIDKNRISCFREVDYFNGTPVDFNKNDYLYFSVVSSMQKKDNKAQYIYKDKLGILVKFIGEKLEYDFDTNSTFRFLELREKLKRFCDKKYRHPNHLNCYKKLDYLTRKELSIKLNKDRSFFVELANGKNMEFNEDSRGYYYNIPLFYIPELQYLIASAYDNHGIGYEYITDLKDGSRVAYIDNSCLVKESFTSDLSKMFCYTTGNDCFFRVINFNNAKSVFDDETKTIFRDSISKYASCNSARWVTNNSIDVNYSIPDEDGVWYQYLLRIQCNENSCRRVDHVRLDSDKNSYYQDTYGKPDWFDKINKVRMDSKLCLKWLDGMGTTDSFINDECQKSIKTDVKYYTEEKYFELFNYVEKQDNYDDLNKRFNVLVGLYKYLLEHSDTKKFSKKLKDYAFNKKTLNLIIEKDYFCSFIKSLPESMSGYQNLMYHIISKDGTKLRCMNNKIKDDVDAVSCAIAEVNNQTKFKNYGLNIKYASDRIKDNKDVALMAVEKNHYAIRYLSDRLKEDLDIMRESRLAKQRNSATLKYSYYYKYNMDLSKCGLEFGNIIQ